MGVCLRYARALLKGRRELSIGDGGIRGATMQGKVFEMVTDEGREASHEKESYRYSLLVQFKNSDDCVKALQDRYCTFTVFGGGKEIAPS